MSPLLLIRTCARNCLFSVGGVIGLATCGLLLILSAQSWIEFQVSADIRIDLIGTNGVLLSPERYATNSGGWAPLVAEEQLICSERLLRKAVDSFDAAGGWSRPEKMADAISQLHAQLIPHGIRLKYSSPDAQESVPLVNGVAEAYCRERNAMTPALPNCSGFSMRLVRPAAPETVVPNLNRIIRFPLLSVLLGLAAGLLASGRITKPPISWLAVAVFWAASFSGLLIVGTQLTVPVALAGAMLFSILITAASAMTQLVSAQHLPIPSKLLQRILVTCCVLMAGFAVLSTLTDSETYSNSARMKVSLSDPDGRELPDSYDPRLIATECALVRSAGLLEEAMDSSSFEQFQSKYGARTRLEGLQILSRMLSIEPVEHTGVIKVHYWSERPLRAGQSTVTRLARAYQSYWEERSRTNPSHGMTVTLLDSGELPGRRDLGAQGRLADTLMHQFVSILFIVVGAYCAAWTARSPRLLWIFPAAAAAAIGYLLILGICSVPDMFGRASSTATASVRSWLPRLYQPVNEWQSRCREMLHDQEALANSDEVLSHALECLKADEAFNKRQSPGFPSDRAGQVVWLKKRVRAFSAQKAFILYFTASADNAGEAALIANSVAEACCSAARTRVGPGWPELEMLAGAVSPGRPEGGRNPLALGLGYGWPCLGLFLLGAAISYGGYVVHKRRCSPTWRQTA